MCESWLGRQCEKLTAPSVPRIAALHAMGSAVSTLAPEDICQLQESTHCTALPARRRWHCLPAAIEAPADTLPPVSLKELQRLYRRFELLDRDRSGTLSPQEVLGIPEFAMNPLTPRLLQMLRINSDQLDFTRFVQYLSVFHKKASRMERLHCMRRRRLLLCAWETNTQRAQSPLTCTTSPATG